MGKGNKRGNKLWGSFLLWTLLKKKKKRNPTADFSLYMYHAETKAL